MRVEIQGRGISDLRRATRAPSSPLAQELRTIPPDQLSSCAPCPILQQG